MKTIIIALITLASVTALANEIKGTLMLKGSLKTKIMVSGIKTVCKLKVEEVKNLLEEDAFGNPGYQVLINISLSGSDFESGRKVKMDKEFRITNMHTVNGVRMVKDLDYFSALERVSVKIDEQGRLVHTTFPYGHDSLRCEF